MVGGNCTAIINVDIVFHVIGEKKLFERIEAKSEGQRKWINAVVFAANV